MRTKIIPLTTSQLSYIAPIHEAGHAVVAAYLRLSFSHATIKPRKLKGEVIDGGHVSFCKHRMRGYSYDSETGRYFFRAIEGVRLSIDEAWAEIRRFVTMRAIAAMGARAAVDHHLRSLPPIPFRQIWHIEGDYGGDEASLKDLSEEIKGTELQVPRSAMSTSEFDDWRMGILQRAQDIVAIPHVSKGIADVAEELDVEYRVSGRGLSSKRVRHIVRQSAYLELPVQNHQHSVVLGGHRSDVYAMAETFVQEISNLYEGENRSEMHGAYQIVSEL
jgi:hypothetical protein